MFAIANTDTDWIEFLKNSQLNSYVNFWTPTPWNIKRLEAGDRFYFMIKSPIRKIGGFGEFVEYKNCTPNQAWADYGYRNGCKTKEDFIARIKKYIIKNSKKFGNVLIDTSSYNIGCIILNNCQFWDESNLKDLGGDISFSKNIVTWKSYNIADTILPIKLISHFEVVADERDDKRGTVKLRTGQGEFNGTILRAYENRCCISNETIPELLQACHIQSYKNYKSHHVQNGLLLRIDIHKLYDNGLLFIDEHYIIHISSLVANPLYQQYNGKSIRLPRLDSEHPSKSALMLKRDAFRN